MNRLHDRLREKRELRYETRHVVGVLLLLLVFGGSMFYAGLLLGERFGAEGKFHGPRQIASTLFDDAVAQDTGEGSGEQDATPPSRALPPGAPRLVNVERLTTVVPAAVRKDAPRRTPTVTADGPVPVKGPGSGEGAAAATGAEAAPAAPATAKVGGRPRPRAVKGKTPKRRKPRPSAIAPSDAVFTVQVYALRDPKSAGAVAKALGTFKGWVPTVDPVDRGGARWFRVRIGEFSSLAEGRAFQKLFEEKNGLANTIVVPR